MPVTEYPSNLSNPFTLGVASGDPLPDGIVLWTRLAPDPLNGGGMERRGDVAVDWEIAADADFVNVLQTSREHGGADRKAKAVAKARLAHSVHLEVNGLEPGMRYWYRFVVGRYESRGRTKTAPETTADVPAMAFAFANCQSWQSGLYPAYRHMAQDDGLDLIVHLGDYIYENGAASGGPRVYETAAPTDLVGYRERHAEYKTDPDLRAAHAAHPWVVTWDDHEVENDYAGTRSWYAQSDFAERRAAAYQAYFEHMPLRPSRVLGRRQWENVNLYRRISYGSLVQFLVLDVRQYRTLQPCGGTLAACKDRLEDPIVDQDGESRRHTILGPDDAQENWLKGVLTSSGPLWNVIASGIPMFEYDHDPSSSGESYYMDGWDGYVATRNRLFQHLVESRVPNPTVIAGDIHAAWVADLKYAPEDPNNSFKRRDSMIVGTEFVGTSISSELSTGWVETYRNALGVNPHVRHFDGRNGGYVRCALTRERWRSDFLLAYSLGDSRSPMRTVASFEVYPEADPSRRKGAVRIYAGRRRKEFLAVLLIGALLAIATFLALFVLSGR